MDQKQTPESLKDCLNRINDKYHPDGVILFGSYAKGEANEDSDIDILVISDYFKNIDDYSRFRELYKMTADLDPEYHIFGFTSKELETRGYLPTIRAALHEGVYL